MWYYWFIPLIFLLVFQFFFTSRNARQWGILNENETTYSHYSDLGFPDFGSSMTDAQTHINFIPRVYFPLLVLCAAAFYFFPSLFKPLVFITTAILLLFAILLDVKVSSAKRVLKSISRVLYPNYLPIKKILSYPAVYFYLMAFIHFCTMAILIRSKAA